MKTRVLLLSSLLILAGCGGSTRADANAASGGSPSSGGASSGGGGGTSSGGGSGGNASGGAAGADAGACGTCVTPLDCILVPSNCCICGMPELEDYVASSKAAADSCGCGGPVCQCASSINPNLAATCSSGVCEGFDVRKVDAFSGCNSDGDCMLRNGLDCCESCGSNTYDLIAVKTDQSALSKALCGAASPPCPPCVPTYPANAKAACLSGHCQVVVQ